MNISYIIINIQLFEILAFKSMIMNNHYCSLFKIAVTDMLYRFAVYFPRDLQRFLLLPGRGKAYYRDFIVIYNILKKSAFFYPVCSRCLARIYNQKKYSYSECKRQDKYDYFENLFFHYSLLLFNNFGRYYRIYFIRVFS